MINTTFEVNICSICHVTDSFHQGIIDHDLKIHDVYYPYQRHLVKETKRRINTEKALIEIRLLKKMGAKNRNSIKFKGAI